MTDQTESASENAELLADLGFYDEDHWRNVMRQYPGAQDAIRKAAAALARMEALAAECIELRDMADDRISGADRRRIDELLAACERRSGG